MKFRSATLLVLLAAIFLSQSISSMAGTKPVMVHYMPWFQGPYSIGGTGWGTHWTYGGYFDPNLTNSTTGEREIGSWYYPLIGPYDSDDPTVLEYHTLLMKLGGIDGVIVDWYGPDNCFDYSINEIRTLAIEAACQKAGLKFALCYEDQTVGNEINANCDGVTAADSVAHAQGTMLYAQTNYFDMSNYLRWSTTNQPVLLNFGPQYFKTNSGWVSIFSVLNSTNQPAFFTENPPRYPVGVGAFDWVPVQGSGTVLSESTLENYLTSFQGSGANWPAFISSAFPRYHDIYAQAGGTSNGYLTDTNGGYLGGTLVETLSRAMTNNSAIVQLVTWNDFGEGTIIEPTADFGYLDLGIVQNCRRQYLDSTFSYTTNDLALAYRLYNLRQVYNTSVLVKNEMNRVYTNIISGNVGTANLELSGIESKSPIMYDLTSTNGQLQFSIGGYISLSGVKVESSTNPATAGWQTVTTLPPGFTTLMTYTTSILPQSPPVFYKLQNAGP